MYSKGLYSVIFCFQETLLKIASKRQNYSGLKSVISEKQPSNEVLENKYI